MRLTNIKAENFKGRTFAYELPPKLAIVGRNFVGKSAVIDAIRWLLMGYVPEVGKLNSALWEYSSGDFMQVSGLLSGPPVQKITRRLEATHGTISKIKATGNVDADAALIPGLNAEHYFGLSDKERVNYVYSAVEPPAGLRTESLIAELDSIHIDGLSDEDLAFTKKQLAPFCANLAKGIPIDSVLSEMREQFTYWNRREKDTVGAVRTLTELKLRKKEVSADTLKEISDELEKQREAESTLRETLVAENARRDRATEVEKERSRLQHILDSKFDGEAEASRFRTLIGEAEAKKTAVGNPINFDDLIEERANQLALFETSHSGLSTARAKLKDIEKRDRCPYCNSEAKGWKHRMESELLAAMERHEREHNAAAAALGKLDTEIANLKRQKEAIGHAIQDNTELTHNINHWKHQIELIEVKAENFNAAQAEARKKLEGLPVVELMSEEDYGALAQKRGTLKNDIWNLSARETALLRLQQDLKRAAESEQEHNHAKAMVKVIKKAAEILNERKKALVEIVFSELLKTANSIFGEILKSPLALFDNTIGRWEGPKFIPHRVFSGTEKALCYTAISVALSAKAPMKLAIIDEFTRLDSPNQVVALDALSKAVDVGVLEQFIVVGTNTLIHDSGRVERLVIE